jgi:hypothetical protein
MAPETAADAAAGTCVSVAADSPESAADDADAHRPRTLTRVPAVGRSGVANPMSDSA